MSEDLNEKKDKKKKSIRGYASSIFKESSVSAVAGILSAESIPRKIFRVLIFLVFTVGFLYQCIKFLSYLLTYPTIVTIEISSPQTYLAPAFTFCNSQKIMRTKYCSKYPDHCIAVDEEFCKNNSKYCETSKMRVKEDSFDNLTYDELLNFRHKSKDLVFDLYHLAPIVIEDEPIIRTTSTYSSTDFSSCYSANSKVNSKSDAIIVNRTDSFTGADKSQYQFIFDPAEEEQFEWSARNGILFSIHSQFDGNNPFYKGFFMKPGRMYKVVLFMEKEILLPYPYKSDCISYHDLWIKNGRTGPRSQEMCREKCLVDFVAYCFNCTHPYFIYPSDQKRICQDPSDEFHSTDNEKCHPPFIEIKLCRDLCKEECQQTKFYPEVREMRMPRKPPGSKNYRNPNLIYVNVEIEDTEVVTYVYKPQYQNVEAFSYIGGFIGIWLGISLVQVTDFIESIFLIARYFCKKRRRPNDSHNV